MMEILSLQEIQGQWQFSNNLAKALDISADILKLQDIVKVMDGPAGKFN